FVTSRLASKLGVGLTLAIIPLLIVCGLFTVALIPLVWVVVALQIFRRAGNYGVTRPAREMLFTAVDRESRFKAKQVIDVVVYRGGDVFWAWSFTALTSIAGLGVAGVALVGSTIAAVWAAIGLYLGRRFESKQEEQDGELKVSRTVETAM
ncbi:MAG: MFS transporter, partial [Pseudomonadota bacterium]